MSDINSPATPKFIPGLQLSEKFFREAVEPILRDQFPQLLYAAALIGGGSEVLGFDTEMSSDHHWGPRVMLFLRPEDVSESKGAVVQKLSEKLPRSFCGFSTSFTPASAENRGVQLLEYKEDGPVNHRVEVVSPEQFFDDYLGFDITTNIDPYDWLTFPGQKLRSIAAGMIFRDCPEVSLEKTRERFSYYPEDVWLFLLACQWVRIEQEEHLMGRAGFVGDEVGAAIIAARLVRDLMNLCFLMDKQYAPYPKWFGTAFKGLKCAGELEPVLMKALTSCDWKERQQHLSQAYESVALLHKQLAITEPVPLKVQAFHERPFSVISMGTYSQAIRKVISNSTNTTPQIRKLLEKPMIGSAEQFSDSTDLLADAKWREQIKCLYTGKEIV